MANGRIGKGFLDAFDALGMVVSNPLILTALIPALAAGQDVVAVPSDDRETAQGCRTVPGQVVCVQGRGVQGRGLSCGHQEAFASYVSLKKTCGRTC